MQNQPGDSYKVLASIGADMQWQRNYFAEIEATAAQLVERRDHIVLRNLWGKEACELRKPELLGFHNTIAAAVEFLAGELEKVERMNAATAPMDWSKRRLHAWER